MKKYNPKKIEKKWQKYWESHKTFQVKEDVKKEKFYSLIEFPYPSGEGLHVGHPRPFTAMDVISRKKRMEGKNVLFPIGFDSFGLPTENYAIKTGKAPAEVTKKNIANFTRQLKMLGYSFDWSRQVDTSNPKYYKWTQWLFLQFFKHDLAYKKNQPINWCPKDKIGLANEEVVNGCCERCGTPVEKRNKEQWMLAITKYADKLLAGLQNVDYIERARVQQENWIGKSEGAEIVFPLRMIPGQSDDKHSVTVFTTRPDTIFGATFVAVSAELAKKWVDVGWQANEDIKKYIEDILAHRKSSREEEPEKTGVEAGIVAINPANQKEIPVWITNYVLGEVGTGAIMGVPADDDRDKEFAEKYNLPIIENYTKAGFEDHGKRVIRYKLRDWVFSRQRYWGEPIPLVNCVPCGGWVPLPESELPLELPKVKKYQPTDTGESPLAAMEKWVNTKCPQCGGPAKRETDTMPNWAGSSWYFLRYADAHNDKEFASQEKLKYWMPVDWYNGGMEHVVLHLLYSRFWNIFLHDIGLVPVSEPYAKRTAHGLILAKGGEKMSKSKGNVVNPDEVVAQYGADTLRTYIMFMGPFDQAVEWDDNGLVGVKRFLDKVWNLQEKVVPKTELNLKLQTSLHQTIQKVGEDIEGMRFNTAISKMMELVNEMSKEEKLSADYYSALLKILSPFAPHMTEELWGNLGNKKTLVYQSWPEYNPELTKESTLTIAIQINGKVRDEIMIDADTAEDEVKKLALASEKVQKWLEGKEPKKVIYVKGKLVSIVI
ncbi:MAG: leucyl-tRNA synthetase, eubacterial and mitochondrial family [Parcubacteria group bacterium Gr01-1014_13]|nr:MAG: leucyl-tRNA synthetase, eubacterial and mitochondrial family [Parcubacteria group bacterium Gr01-1014_13]